MVRRYVVRSFLDECGDRHLSYSFSSVIAKGACALVLPVKSWHAHRSCVWSVCLGTIVVFLLACFYYYSLAYVCALLFAHRASYVILPFESRSFGAGQGGQVGMDLFDVRSRHVCVLRVAGHTAL
jgi:hypothetical protein